MTKNKNLETLFNNIDTVLIRDTSYSTKDFIAKTVVCLTNEFDIQELLKMLEIDETFKADSCMCQGDYQIDLYSNNELMANISFHHGETIRYKGWDNDATLLFGMKFYKYLSKKKA